jgi:hypothetical protein
LIASIFSISTQEGLLGAAGAQEDTAPRFAAGDDGYFSPAILR